MSRAGKDALATGVVALVVLTLFATWRRWDVVLVGQSHRWAAALVLVLGCMTCGLGEHEAGSVNPGVVLLGAFALTDGVFALVTGSLVALVLLVVDIVLLWVVATAAHARRSRSAASPA